MATIQTLQIEAEMLGVGAQEAGGIHPTGQRSQIAHLQCGEKRWLDTQPLRDLIQMLAP